MASLHRMLSPCQWFARLASALDKRWTPRLTLLFLGAGTRSWPADRRPDSKAAGLSDQFRPCYTAVAAAGKKAEAIAAYLAHVWGSEL